MNTSITRTLLYSVFAAFVCMTAVSSPALAQKDQMKPSADKAEPSPTKLQAEARKISMQLNDIETKALKEDKDLQAKSEHLTQHIMKVMKEKGFKPEADRLELASIRKEIMSGKLKKDERQAKIQEFQAVRARLIKAQRVAMQDATLRQESREFAKATMDSMEKADPKTKKLFKRLGEIRNELQAIYKKQRQSAAK